MTATRRGNSGNSEGVESTALAYRSRIIPNASPKDVDYGAIRGPRSWSHSGWCGKTARNLFLEESGRIARLQIDTPVSPHKTSGIRSMAKAMKGKTKRFSAREAQVSRFSKRFLAFVSGMKNLEALHFGLLKFHLRFLRRQRPCA